MKRNKFAYGQHPDLNNLKTNTKLFHGFKVCVIVPTYNNHKTIIDVIEGVKQFIDDMGRITSKNEALFA